MFIQLVTYRLDGISEDDYLDMANGVVNRFSAMGGLRAKVWLEGTEDGSYGAVYFWDDEEAMQRFTRSDLFEATSAEFSDVESQGFTVLENLTRSTQPVLDIIGARPRPAPSPILGRDPAEGSPEVPGGRAGGTMATSKRKAPAKPAAKPKAKAKAAPRR